MLSLIRCKAEMNTQSLEALMRRSHRQVVVKCIKERPQYLRVAWVATETLVLQEPRLETVAKI